MIRKTIVILTVAVSLGAAPAVRAAGPPCTPEWSDEFTAGAFDGTVRAFAWFDDGRGPALYAAGDFRRVNDELAIRIARWDGAAWSPLGSGLNDSVHALTVFDDGGGPALFAAGEFSRAGGRDAQYVAKWNGTEWLPLPDDIGDDTYALAVFDDGNGPSLFAAGGPENIARWGGAGWVSVGGGANRAINALLVFDDGAGPALYAAGSFTEIGGAAANRVAKWDGSSWSPLGAGRERAQEALAVFDDGTGPALYSGGTLAKWDGTTWTEIPGLPRTTHTLGSGVIDGRRVLLVGLFAYLENGTNDHLWTWDGQTLAPAAARVNSSVHAIANFNEHIYIGGDFVDVGGVTASRVAEYDGTEWRPVGNSDAGNGMDRWVGNLASVGPEGLGTPGARLFATGVFYSAGAEPARGIAAWDGEAWTALPSDIDSEVTAVLVYDDGSGRALYAGGRFSRIGGVQANGLARWDGFAWSPMGSGTNGSVYSFASYDDGSGTSLYAVGDFTEVDGVATRNIAKWDGVTWSSLGTGISRVAGELCVYDDGTGPALYAAGQFDEAGGIPVNNIAKWDGLAWSDVGGGVSGGLADIARDLAVFDDGSGPELFVGGYFGVAGGVPVNRIAKWNGTRWAAVGAGVGAGFSSLIDALAVFDDGSGSKLYVGGEFLDWNDAPGNRVAVWDGTTWAPLDVGTNGRVIELYPFDDGRGPGLYVGGLFTRAGGKAAPHIARWGCIPPPRGDLDGDGDVDLHDLASMLEWFGACAGDPSYHEIADFDADGCIGLADLAVLLGNYGA